MIVVFNRVKGIEHGRVDFQLNFLGKSTHVFQVLRGEQVLELVKPENDEVEAAIEQEHGAINVRPHRAGKIRSSQLCVAATLILSVDMPHPGLLRRSAACQPGPN